VRKIKRFWQYRVAEWYLLKIMYDIVLLHKWFVCRNVPDLALIIIKYELSRLITEDYFSLDDLPYVTPVLTQVIEEYSIRKNKRALARSKRLTQTSILI
jgi:hypothetical protein